MKLKGINEYWIESRVVDPKKFSLWLFRTSFTNHKKAIEHLMESRKTWKDQGVKFRIKEVVHTELILPI